VVAPEEAGRGVDDDGVLRHGPIVADTRDTCLSSVLGLFGRRFAPREEQVQLAASFAKDGVRPGDVGCVPGPADLPGGREQLEGLITEIAMAAAHRTRRLCPGCGPGGELGGLLSAGVGQLEDTATAISLDSADEAFVLELLESGVHGAGTRSPRPVAAALEFLNDLVAVRWLLGQEDEDRRTYVATRGTPARTEGLAEATRTTEGGGKVRGVEGRPSSAVTVASAVLEVLADVVVEACGGIVAGSRPLLMGVRVGSFSGHVGSLRGG
jgi:hypothetical protein